MKTPVLKWQNLVSSLTILGFTVLISFVLPVMPVLAIELEIGTQFGISRLIPDDEDDASTSITYARFPSGTFLDIGSSPTSFYAMLFPNKRFAIGPEFSFGRTSFSDRYEGERETLSITTVHLGGRAAFFLLNHSGSSPYVFGRVSRTVFSGEEWFFLDDNQVLTSFGGGFGYQLRIGSAFVLRAEGQYQRLLLSDEDDDADEFSLMIGFGTRFGRQ